MACMGTVVACGVDVGCVSDIIPSVAVTTHFLSEPADAQCVGTAQWTADPHLEQGGAGRPGRCLSNLGGSCCVDVEHQPI